MESLEKCIRNNSLITRLQKLHPELTYIDCIKLKNKLFETFINAVEAKYDYLELDIDIFIKNIINQANH